MVYDGKRADSGQWRMVSTAVDSESRPMVKQANGEAGQQWMAYDGKQADSGVGKQVRGKHV